MREIDPSRKIDKNNPVKINAFEVHDLHYPLHYHPSEYELTLVLGGSGVRIFGDNISEFGTADLALVGPGIPHCWISQDHLDPDSGTVSFQVITIQFNHHIIGKELLVRPEFEHIRNLFKESHRGILFGDHSISRVVDKFMELKLEPDFDTFLTILDILNQLAKYGDYDTLCSREYHFRGKPEELKKFESVFKHIQYNYLRKIKITEVAGLVEMNDSAFSHYFKKRTMYSFTDFINLLRLNYAADQICKQPKNIADICFESGFNNLSNFNRMFKKWKGETPLQYRKKHRNEDARH